MKTPSEKSITIQITSATIFKIVFVGVMCYALYRFHELIVVILTAVVLASAIEPLTAWFVKRKVPRAVGVFSIYAMAITSFIAILYAFVPPVISDIVSIENTYNLSAFFPGIDTVSSQTVPAHGVSVKDILVDLQKSFSGSPESTIQTMSKIFGGLLSFVLIIVFSFYLSVQKNGVSDFLRIITPEKQETYVIDLWKRTQHKIGLWMQGQLLLGVLIGVLVFLGLSLLQVPYALALALLAGVLEIIPIFGPVLAAIPAVLFAYTHGAFLGSVALSSIGSALAVGMLYVIIQQFENHLIYPLVVRKLVGVPPLLVIVGVIIGFESAGFLGVILAVPITAALMEFVDDVQKEKKPQQARHR